MRATELVKTLKAHSDCAIRFQLPTGDLVPAHAHVTEVARVDKKFIDCGGTFREESVCRLQTWIADDYHHRLSAGKLAVIIDKAKSILGEDDLEVDVEHDLGFVTQLSLLTAAHEGNEVILVLTGKNTACLAPELCCPTPNGLEVVTLGKKGSPGAA
jgi:hypothetical protein